MVKSRYIIIWGANPAWCSMHSMKYIYKAREKGAKIVVIDPLLTQTAAKADLYLRIRPGTDGALALGMCRHLVDKGLVDSGAVFGYSDRALNINQTAQEILDANDPPIRMLWVACKNPFAQDFDRNKMLKAFEKLEMVVCVDQFFNETVQHADIVLPCTTTFEEWNVDSSYWHYWISINEPAIKPMYESKSDLKIATLLSRTINKLEEGSCTFPQKFEPKKWLDKEFNEGMAKMFGISSWEDHP